MFLASAADGCFWFRVFCVWARLAAGFSSWELGFTVRPGLGDMEEGPADFDCREVVGGWSTLVMFRWGNFLARLGFLGCLVMLIP